MSVRKRAVLRRLAVAGVAALATLTVVGCSNSAAPAKQVPPAQRLATARQRLEQSPAVSLSVESSGLPGKAVGVSGGRGTGLFNPPSFKGTLNATVSGVTGTVDVIAVDKDVYMKFFTPGYIKIDPKTYGAPNPAQLFSTQTGITSLIGRTAHLAAGPSVRDGADVLSTITGTLPGSAVADLLVIGERTGTFDVTYGLTDPGGDLRSVVLKGPFYAGSTSTYTLRVQRLAQPVAITRP
ncbi:MAG TPA: LppX_LprAFG lipoprotein [Pedococcus sp.]|jgi:lipoprotein LprG|nr:LppX_LprAFG lipoprotein [Pedococcus sp.]